MKMIIIDVSLQSLSFQEFQMTESSFSKNIKENWFIPANPKHDFFLVSKFFGQIEVSNRGGWENEFQELNHTLDKFRRHD